MVTGKSSRSHQIHSTLVLAVVFRVNYLKVTDEHYELISQKWARMKGCPGESCSYYVDAVLFKPGTILFSSTSQKEVLMLMTRTCIIVHRNKTKAVHIRADPEMHKT